MDKLFSNKRFGKERTDNLLSNKRFGKDNCKYPSAVQSGGKYLIVYIREEEEGIYRALLETQSALQLKENIQ